MATQEPKSEWRKPDGLRSLPARPVLLLLLVIPSEAEGSYSYRLVGQFFVIKLVILWRKTKESSPVALGTITARFYDLFYAIIPKAIEDNLKIKEKNLQACGESSLGVARDDLQ